MAIFSIPVRATAARLACLLLLANPISAAQSYLLDTSYSGANFFDGWDFFSGPDPTHGYVLYRSKTDAANQGLWSAAAGQPAYMGVDSTNVYNPNGYGRASVRISTQKSWTHGLFIADIAHMPGSACGTWPAFWMFGPNWPSNGEIDMIEGVNSAGVNQVALHTGPNCVMSAGTMTGTMTTGQCDGTQNGNNGCTIKANDGRTYGTGFNNAGGGVYATEWTSNYINVWFFPRGSIPSDITAGTPNPASWPGSPLASYQGGGGCNIDTHFASNNLVFDTTFCGDWAANVWAYDATCSPLASTCQQYVAANPSAFQQTYWSINSVKVYQLGTAPSSNPPPSNAPWTWVNQGCYTDNANARTLTTSINMAAGSNTVANCQNICLYSGYVYAGVENGSQCWCGNSISNNGAPTTSGCNVACSGNSNQWCGGTSTLNVYHASQNPSWSNLGCYTDNASAPTLVQKVSPSGGDTANTPSRCQSICILFGWQYAGLEAGNQCWCGSAIYNGGHLATSADGSATCSTPCAGDNTQICGGTSRMTLYKFG